MSDLLIVSLSAFTDKAPDPTAVKAGPLGFALWIFMIIAVVVIGFSLVRQLRRAQANKDAGLFGDEPVNRDDRADTPSTTDER
ncbi:hypothetical protein EUA06_06795 [Nocardioides glacieisoli]|uniref:Uncharacterized protein n=1 Tax=Nocardioides glacieisoli TaxID=1168730 RepID=A0A4V1RKK9_9ACTN|nr:hypothetical protein [Nocardioides glacieisoli]RYB92642.1 hypothetical protein EUA06_06795 [Nocardioides glacieisoli]